MILARASGTLTKPWDLATNGLDAAFDESPDEAGTRTWYNASTVYTLKLTADRSTGSVEITVSTPFPYVPIAVGTVLFVMLVAITTTTLYAALATLFVSLLVCLFPLVPGIVHYQRLYRHLPDVLDIEDARITPAVLAPLVGYLFSMWLLATSDLYQLLAALLTAFLIPSTAYAVGLTPSALRRQFPALVFAFFPSFPLLLTVGNFGFLRIVTDELTPELASISILILAASTVMLLAVYSRLSRVYVTMAQEVPNQPISSRAIRVLWFGYFICLNLSLLVLITTLLFGRWWIDDSINPVDSVTAVFRVSGVPYPTTAAVGSVGILALPLIIMVLYWVIHIRNKVNRYRRIQRETIGIEFDGSEYPIRIINSTRPFAFSSPQSHKRGGIVLSSTLYDELSHDELQAIIAHEEYHIRNRDLIWNKFSSIFGFLVGGQNVLAVARDYPHIEQEADRYAAEQHGADALIRALRTSEQLRTTTPQQPDPQFDSSESTTDLTWLFGAPYHVLFGSIVQPYAHTSIDERVERILSTTGTDHTGD